MSLTAFVTGEALTQARLATLTNEITADIAAEAAARTAAIAAAGLPSTAANLVLAGPASGSAAIAAARALVGADMPAGVFKDWRPVTANAYDSEFDVDDAAWVSMNLGSNVVRSVNRSRLILKVALAEATDALRGIARPCPSGAFRVEFSGIRQTALFRGGFGAFFRRAGGTAPNVANVTTDKQSGIHVVAQSSTIAYVDRWTGSTVYNTYDKGGYEIQKPHTWDALALEFNGTDTLKYEFSSDNGASWVEFCTLSATTVLGGVPDSLSFVVDPGGTQNTYNTGGYAVSIDAIRRTI